MTTQPDYELQLAAMRSVMEALKPLNETGREAVLTWISSQLGIQIAQSNARPADSISKDSSPKREGTVSVVAQKIGAKSARDLLLASAVHLTLYQSKDSFTRDELIACAKEARSWKASYANQMAVNIKRMSDAGVLFEKARNVFGLSDVTLTEMEERLAR